MSSNIGLKTLVIAVFFSVILSTSIVMYVPQVQDALIGPQGEPGLQGEQGIPGESIVGSQGETGPQGLRGVQGIQGIPGETGSPGISEVTQAELDELAIRIDELGNTIAELEEGGIGILQLTSSIVTLEDTIESLESDLDQMDDYILYRVVGWETSSLWDMLTEYLEPGAVQEGDLGEIVAADPDISDIYQIGVDPWDTLIALRSNVNSLRSELDSLTNYITNVLRPQVSDLETDVSDLETDTPVITPIYDSRWFGIDKGTNKYLTTLPNQNVFVYMIGRTSGNTAHHLYYGGDSQLVGTIQLNKGAYWMINSDNQLRVYREGQDNYYKYIRVIVWQLP